MCVDVVCIYIIFIIHNSGIYISCRIQPPEIWRGVMRTMKQKLVRFLLAGLQIVIVKQGKFPSTDVGEACQNLQS